MEKCLTCHYGVEHDFRKVPCFRGEPSCYQGGPSMWKPYTNADKVRTKTDKELAALLYAYSRSPAQDREKILRWLREEAKE